MEPVILRTDRLELSRPVGADAKAIFFACQDPDVQRYTTIPSPYLPEHAAGFIDLVATGWAEGTETHWAVRRDSGLVGMIGVHRIDGRGGGEIGYWVAAEARGQGLLTEAARAVIDWSFSADGLGLERLEWLAVAGNIPSAAAARRLGFRYEGLRRQALLSPRGREDAWSAALLVSDDRSPRPWPVLPD